MQASRGALIRSGLSSYSLQNQQSMKICRTARGCSDCDPLTFSTPLQAFCWCSALSLFRRCRQQTVLVPLRPGFAYAFAISTARCHTNHQGMFGLRTLNTFITKARRSLTVRSPSSRCFWASTATGSSPTFGFAPLDQRCSSPGRR